MDRETGRRVRLLREGQQRLRRTTGWLVAGAIALAAVFAGAFGAAAAAHSAATSSYTGSGSSDDGDNPDGSDGSGLLPPTGAPQAPQNQGGGSHAQSGAS